MRTKSILSGISAAFLFTLISSLSFCQKNYLPGYIIMLTGDTVKGTLDYRNWERNPRKIAFLASGSSETAEYSPATITGFGVLDEIYISAVIETEVSSDKTGDLTFDPTLNMVVDSGFLQVLVRGDKSLYLFRNKLGKEQFYIGQDSAMELLVYKKYLKSQNGQSSIVENKKYIGQLTLYLSDCQSISQKLQNTNYQQNSLEKLFLTYYDDKHSSPSFYKKPENLILAFGIKAGASYTKLTFHSANFIYLVEASYKPSYNFTCGVNMDVILTRNNRKWSICNELLFTHYGVEGEYTDYTNENKYTIYSSRLGYMYLKLNNLIRFKLPVGKVFLYANAGISNGFAFVERNEMTVTSKLYDQERVEQKKALDDTRKYEVGFLGGLGAGIGRFSFEARYEYATGMSPYNNLRSNVDRIYLFLGFRF
ncbi:MAG: PorT family protein [Bacteroidales bacterium]|nr:PorT family protein [Bacteroidales bacterium]